MLTVYVEEQHHVYSWFNDTEELFGDTILNDDLGYGEVSPRFQVGSTNTGGVPAQMSVWELRYSHYRCFKRSSCWRLQLLDWMWLFCFSFAVTRFQTHHQANPVLKVTTWKAVSWQAAFKEPFPYRVPCLCQPQHQRAETARGRTEGKAGKMKSSIFDNSPSGLTDSAPFHPPSHSCQHSHKPQ